MSVKRYLVNFLTLTLIGCASIPVIERNEILEISEENVDSLENEKLQFSSNFYWEEYGDENLNELMALILESNSTLKIASLNIEKSEAAIRGATSSMFPTFLLGSSYSKIENSHTSKTPVLPQYMNMELVDFNLKGTLELDLWGKYSSLIEKSNLEKDALTLMSKRVESGITTKVLSLYGYYAHLLRERKILGSIKKSLEDRVDMNITGVRLGKKTEDSVYYLKREVENVNSLLSSNSHNLDVVNSSLNALANFSYNEEIDNILSNISEENTNKLFSNMYIPENISSEVIANRPDVLQYLKLIEAREQDLIHAKSLFYPSISISGQLGFETIHPDQLFKEKSHLNVGGIGVYLPLFNLGGITAKYLIEGVNLNLMIEEYNSTLVKAIDEVNSSLSLVKESDALLLSQRKKLEESKKISDLTKKRVNLGYLPKEESLTSEVSLLQEKLVLEKQLLNRFNSSVKFIYSIGGTFSKGEIKDGK